MTYTDPLTLVLLGISYLLGSIPFGLVLTRLAGLGDIRTIGSGNIGATNVLRTGRKDLAALTLILDAGKGAIAAIMVLFISGPEVAPFAGAAAFLGHCYPIFLGFRGGKGVATFFGTLFAVNWMVALIAGASWLATAVVARISSLSALIAALAAVIAALQLMSMPAPFAIALMTLLIYVRHKDNIKRLIKRTEPRIGAKSTSDADGDSEDGADGAS